MTVARSLDRVTLADHAEGIRCTDESHRSFSADRRFDACAMQDHLLRLGAGSDYMGPEACVGSAVDAAICSIIETRRYLDTEALVVAAIADMADPASSGQWDLQPLVEKAERLWALWETEVWPDYERIGVWATQLELHWDVDDIPYHAHLDVVLADGSVRDLKTSEKRLPERWADHSVQLTTYAYALREVYGQAPGAVGFDGLIYANPPADVRAWNPAAIKPWLDRQDSTRTPAQLTAWAEDVRRREAARRWSTETGIYTTAGRSGMEYVCARCPARPVCPSWSGFDTGLAATAALS